MEFATSKEVLEYINFLYDKEFDDYKIIPKLSFDDNYFTESRQYQ